MFQIGDIVEVLNITPDEAQYLDAQLFIGMRYKIEKIWQPGELLSSDTEIRYVLAGFPKNSIGYTTFFTEKQLWLYHRPDEALHICKKKKI